MTDASAMLLSTHAAFAGLIAQAGEPAEAVQEAAVATGAPGWLLFIAFLLIVGLPFLLGWAIAKALRLPDTATRFGVVLLVAFIGVAPFVWNVAVGARQGLSVRESLAESIKLGVDLAGGTNLVYQVVETPEKPLTAQVLDNMVGSIVKRINPSGTEEVTVRRVGRDRIEVIVPGADPEKVRRIKTGITRLGSLEFGLLANERDHATLISDALALPGSEDDVRQGGRIVASWKDVARDAEGNWKLDFAAPGTRYVNRQQEVLPAPPEGSPEDVRKQVLIVTEPEDRRVTGEYLRSASPTRDESGRPAVSFNFNSRGGTLFGRLTSENLPAADGFKRQLAILLDGKVHSAPSINSTITTSGIIEGRFTQDEVRELVSVLNAGALEVPIDPEPVSEFTISPLLGEDTIRKSVSAMIWAGIAVFVVTAVYYLLAGLIADFCLVLNLILLLGVMSFVDATFTLPGLAGVVLTIGMAVDANVLIFERMREEFDRGSSMRLAVQNGFDRALSAIVDSNVTTLITAVILFIIGTDAVRGFAVSLFIGIVVSMFTALYVGRLIFDVMERKRWVRRMHMNRLFSNPHIDFLGYKKPFIVVSALLIALGVGMLFYRGARMLDIDFLGGTMVTFQLDEPTTSTQVRQILDKVPGFEGNVSVERLVLTGEDRGEEGRRFRVRTTMRDRLTRAEEQAAGQEGGASPADQQTVAQSIAGAFDEAGMKIRRVTFDIGEIRPIEGEAAEGSFAGGSQVELTFGKTADGEQQELNADTAAGLLAEELREFGGDQPKYDEPADLIRVIGTAGSGMTAAENEVKTFSKVRVEASPVIDRADFDAALREMQAEMTANPVFDEVNSFDSSVAGETQQSALMAIFASWVAIIGYLWFRFQDINYGLAAVIALIHDVAITLGLLALASYLGAVLGPNFLMLEEFKINLPMVAAVLTLIGYSINDTIVVFDRIREVRGKNPALTESVVNASLNSTLSRTLLTSVTTLIVCTVLYFFGGEGIHGFTFILTLGIIVGTFSSIYIASPVLLWLTNRKRPRPAATPVRQTVTT